MNSVLRLSASIGFCIAFTGCSQGAVGTSRVLPGVEQAVSQQSIVREANVHRLLFGFDGADGRYPATSLAAVNGALYGVTGDGGTMGAGVVFKITTAGKETVVYNFQGGADGASPSGALVNVNGTLYGTTAEGGTGVCYTQGCGTVFSLTLAGEKTVLYNFQGGTDGSYPAAALVNIDGKLYGTTVDGGINNYGTVFSVTTVGAENVVYRFQAGSDGYYPSSGLVAVNGTMYGTTFDSGGVQGHGDGDGTVFKVTNSGVESVLYHFKGGHDGLYPAAGLIDVNGTLYGTTTKGGGPGSHGTVFAITPEGKYNVLHRFKGSADGGYPNAGLTDFDGALYGTTSFGGTNSSGTAYKISTSGQHTVIFNFQDGATPDAGVTALDGVLYGTTPFGGAHHDGTVYSLSP